MLVYAINEPQPEILETVGNHVGARVIHLFRRQGAQREVSQVDMGDRERTRLLQIREPDVRRGRTIDTRP